MQATGRCVGEISELSIQAVHQKGFCFDIYTLIKETLSQYNEGVAPEPEETVSYTNWEQKYKDANQFIQDLAKAFGEDDLGKDGNQWTVEDFVQASSSKEGSKEREFGEWIGAEHYHYDDGAWYQHWYRGVGNTNYIGGTEKLYQIYLQQLNNK